MEGVLDVYLLLWEFVLFVSLWYEVIFGIWNLDFKKKNINYECLVNWGKSKDVFFYLFI